MLMFLISGVLHLIIGVLTPVMIDSAVGRSVFFISNRTDTELLGKNPSTLLEQNKELALVRKMLAGVMGGWLAVIGVFIITVAWFGLRRQQQWALVTLFITGALLIPFWLITFKPYFNAGISIRFIDLPPILWIPAILLIPATILGWIGIR